MNHIRRAFAILATVAGSPVWCAAAQDAGANTNPAGSPALQSSDRPRSLAGRRPLESDADQPVSADLRPAFAGFGLTPREQGGRGTCSVFAVTQALEFAVARRKGAGERLSEEFLNWASNQAIGHVADGGFFSDLWKGFEKHGVCAESAMPYREKFEPDSPPSADATAQAAAILKLGLRLHWIKEWDASTGLSAEHLASIKRTIAGGWPVFTGLRWPKKPEWSDNVLRMAAPADVFDGHSILFVGYRDDPAMPGGGVFIFRNSSGPARESEMTYEYALAYANDAAWIDAECPGAPADRNEHATPAGEPASGPRSARPAATGEQPARAIPA